MFVLCFFFFFFQAEDGIRDHCVTGVQTCALPIWTDPRRRPRPRRGARRQGSGERVFYPRQSGDHSRAALVSRTCGGRRSEERRVGKECRCGWGTEEEKKEKMKREGTATQ